MSKRFKQVNTFINGIGQDVEEHKLDVTQYRDAINMQLVESGDVMALSNMTGTVEFTTGAGARLHLPTGFKFIGAFVGDAFFDSDGEPFEAIIAFAQNDQGEAQIFQVWSAGLNTLKIYDDLQPPTSPANPRRTNLNLGDKIDAYILRDGNDSYIYWVDDVNPPRYLKLGVNAAYVADNSVAPYSEMYIPNEVDLLYVQRLFPVDPVTIAGVVAGGGNLLAGTYNFAYRYYNTYTQKYSTWSLITNPVPVIQDDTATVNTNDIAGYAPGAVTNKAIRLNINKSDYHNRLYDSIQIAIIRNTGISGSPLTVSLTTPSTDYYGTVSTLSDILITGNEGLTDTVLSDVTIEDASLMTGMTFEEADGRFFIGNIKYWDLEVGAQSNMTAQTVKQNLPVPIDPMDSQTAAGKGYYDEMNNHNYRGYFRGEVYRFGLTYVNKFGHWARPNPLDFSAPALGYDPGDHTNTWQLNWSTSKDWKFADRESQEGSLFDTSTEAISAFGLQVGGIDNHPDWAYGMSIVRMDRKKDILGQTPVINGVAYQGSAFQTGYYDVLTEPGWTRYFYESDASFDYDGSQDFFGPKIMAQGHAKNLTYGMLQLGVDYRSNHHYLIWERLGTKEYGTVNPIYDSASYDGKTYNKATNSFLFLYPLEYMANVGGEENSGLLLDGTESLKIIDAVAFSSFNSFRDSRFAHGIAEADVNFKDGTESRYAWVFAPKNKTAYYYHNGHPVGNMLLDGAAVTAGTPVINVAPSGLIRINAGYKFDWASPPEVLSSPYSNDESMRHIRYLLNGTELAVNQTANSDSYWKDINMCAPYPVVAQRGLAVSLSIADDGDNTLQMVADPTYFVWKRYVDGTPTVPFSTLFPGNPTIDGTAVSESHKATAQTTAEWDLAKADFPKTPLIDPDTSVIAYVANIVRGLGDDRYGDENTAQSYIFTGAYEPVTQAMIDGNTPVQKDVFGGDCFITRNTFQLRTNAVKKDAAIIDEPTPGTPSRWHIEDTVTSGYYYIDEAHKATTFVEFSEMVDLWVESEINGHYIFRDKNKYPGGVDSRDAGHTDYAGTPDYSYPESGISTYTDSRRYLYNPAYSAENNHKVFISRDLNERILESTPARIHYSNQRILNTGIQSDRFLTADFYDLDPSKGDLVKLVEGDEQRLVGIQRNGVAMLYLGNTMTSDTEGFTLNIKSGDVIGNSRYLSENSETGGDVGAQNMSMVRKGDGAIWFYDEKREAVFSISGDRIRNHSDGRMFFSRALKSSHYGLDGLERYHNAWYDNRRGRYAFYISPNFGGADLHRGASYITRKDIWETQYDFGSYTHLVDVCTVENRSFYFINDHNTNTGRIMWNTDEMTEVYTNGSFFINDNQTLLLEDNVGSVSVVLNNGQHRDVPKTLINVVSHSNRPPSSLDLSVAGGFLDPDQADNAVEFRKERHNMYIANEFRAINGQRFKDANILITLHFDASENGLANLSSVISTYRANDRRIL